MTNANTTLTIVKSEYNSKLKTKKRFPKLIKGTYQFNALTLEFYPLFTQNNDCRKLVKIVMQSFSDMYNDYDKGKLYLVFDDYTVFERNYLENIKTNYCEFKFNKKMYKFINPKNNNSKFKIETLY